MLYCIEYSDLSDFGSYIIIQISSYKKNSLGFALMNIHQHREIYRGSLSRLCNWILKPFTRRAEGKKEIRSSLSCVHLIDATRMNQILIDSDNLNPIGRSVTDLYVVMK